MTDLWQDSYFKTWLYYNSLTILEDAQPEKEQGTSSTTDITHSLHMVSLLLTLNLSCTCL